jgi:hypothetical protein
VRNGVATIEMLLDMPTVSTRRLVSTDAARRGLGEPAS